MCLFLLEVPLHLNEENNRYHTLKQPSLLGVNFCFNSSALQIVAIPNCISYNFYLHLPTLFYLAIYHYSELQDSYTKKTKSLNIGSSHEYKVMKIAF